MTSTPRKEWFLQSGIKPNVRIYGSYWEFSDSMKVDRVSYCNLACDPPRLMVPEHGPLLPCSVFGGRIIDIFIVEQPKPFLSVHRSSASPPFKQFRPTFLLRIFTPLPSM